MDWILASDRLGDFKDSDIPHWKFFNCDFAKVDGKPVERPFFRKDIESGKIVFSYKGLFGSNELPESEFHRIVWLDEQDEGWVSVFNGILEFTKTTFPDAGPVEHLKKLVQEAWEASKAPGDITEYADCLLCLFAAAGKAGITHDQLIKAAAKKLEECKGRKWQRLEDGTYQHIPATKD